MGINEDVPFSPHFLSLSFALGRREREENCVSVSASATLFLFRFTRCREEKGVSRGVGSNGSVHLSLPPFFPSLYVGRERRKEGGLELVIIPVHTPFPPHPPLSCLEVISR